jgi:ribosome-binding factor A
MSQRLRQIESTLHKAIAQVIQRGVADPRVRGLVSVTRVEADPDLRQARVFVSVLPEQHESRTIHGLRDAAPYLHKQVKQLLALRVVPHLDFRLDRGLKKTEAVYQAIQEAAARTPDIDKLEENPAAEPSEASDDSPDKPQE